MKNITSREVELLAKLLARATLNEYEVDWANNIIAKIRAAVKVVDRKPE